MNKMIWGDIMCGIKNFFKSLWTSFCNIRLIDKCLMLIFIIILAQSVFALLNPADIESDVEHIDIVLRTALASIFGYILSANFNKKASSANIATKQSSPAQIGFSEAETLQPTDTIKMADSQKSNTKNTKTASPKMQYNLSEGNKLQTIVITSICVISLVILMVIRDVETGLEATSSAVSTITQLRDFVSACVGFLIGNPDNRLNSK